MARFTLTKHFRVLYLCTKNDNRLVVLEIWERSMCEFRRWCCSVEFLLIVPGRRSSLALKRLLASEINFKATKNN